MGETGKHVSLFQRLVLEAQRRFQMDSAQSNQFRGAFCSRFSSCSRSGQSVCLVQRSLPERDETEHCLLRRLPTARSSRYEGS